MLEGVLRFFNFVLAYVMAAATVTLAYLDRPESAGITAALCSFLFFFVFLARFKRFKGFGIEGELWEQEMEKAAELRRDLQDLAKDLSRNIAWQVATINRLDAGTYSEKRDAIERLTRILERMKVSPEEIAALYRPWHATVMIDLARPITQQLRDQIIANKRQTGECIRAEKKRRMAERPGTTELTPQETALTKKYDALDREMAQLPGLMLLEDYENLPRRLREFIDRSISLSRQERQAIYDTCSEEFRDIDQYARDRTFRRPDVAARLL